MASTVHNQLKIGRAVVDHKQPAKSQDPVRRPEQAHTRLTRDGNEYLAVDIPPYGISSSGCRRCLLGVLIGLVVGGVLIIVGSILLAVFTGIGQLFQLFQLLTVIILGLVFAILLRSYWFNHETLKITASEYSLHRRKVALGSMFNIVFFPSHFNDLEKGAIAETRGTEFRWKRQTSIKAELGSWGQIDHRTLKCIRLGSIFFAYLFDEDEVKWLADQINRFLDSRP